MMTEHLIARGHRRIAHISGPSQNPEAAERIRGYRDALAAAGIARDDGLVWPGGFDPGSGLHAIERFFALADRPTAIFAASDETAIGCIKALRGRRSFRPRRRLRRRLRRHRIFGDVRSGADHRAAAARASSAVWLARTSSSA